MAFKLAEAFVQLEQRGFSSVASAVDGLKGKLGALVVPANRAGAAISTFLGNTASQVLMRVAGAAAGTCQSMFELAASAEDNQVAFEVMLGSAEKAKAMLAEMKTFADATPFTPDQIREAGKTLLQFGVDAGNIMPTIKMLGDISAGDAQKFQSLALVMGQISANGRLQGQDLLQLVNAGFNPLQVISKQTGESMASLREKMEKGGISAQMVADAFKAASSEGGQFHGMMERRSKTFTGLMSTLKGDVESALAAIGTKLIDGLGLKEGITKVSAFVKSIGASIAPAMDSVLPSIRSGIETAIQWLTTLKDFFEPVRDAYFRLWSTMGEMIYTVFASAGETISIFFEVFGTDVKSAINWVRDLWTAFLDFVTGVIDGERMVLEHWDLSWAIIVASGELVWENLTTIVRTGITNIAELFPWLANNWYDVLMTMFDAAATIFINIGQNLRDTFASLWDWISSGFTTELPDFGAMWGESLLDGFHSTIKEMPDLTEMELKTTNDKLQSLYAEFADREAKRTEERLKKMEALVPPALPEPVDAENPKPFGSSANAGANAGKGETKFIGLADLNKTMQQAASGTNQAALLASINAKMDRSVKAQEKTATLLDGMAGEPFDMVARYANQA